MVFHNAFVEGYVTLRFPPTLVFGIPYPGPNGEPARPTLHVDLCSARVHICHRRHQYLLDNQLYHKTIYARTRDIDEDVESFNPVS